MVMRPNTAVMTERHLHPIRYPLWLFFTGLKSLFY